MTLTPGKLAAATGPKGQQVWFMVVFGQPIHGKMDYLLTGPNGDHRWYSRMVAKGFKFHQN